MGEPPAPASSTGLGVAILTKLQRPKHAPRPNLPYDVAFVSRLLGAGPASGVSAALWSWCWKQRANTEESSMTTVSSTQGPHQSVAAPAASELLGRYASLAAWNLALHSRSKGTSRRRRQDRPVGTVGLVRIGHRPLRAAASRCRCAIAGLRPSRRPCPGDGMTPEQNAAGPTLGVVFEAPNLMPWRSVPQMCCSPSK